MNIPSRRQAAHQESQLPVIGILAFVLAGLLLAGWIVFSQPFWQEQPLNPTDQWNLYYMGELSKGAVYREGEELYLSFDFIKNNFDSTIRWDETNQLVIVTTKENVYHFPLGFKDGLQNLEPYDFTYPVINKEDTLYLPVDPLKDFYHLEIYEDKESSLVRVHNLALPIQRGKLLADVKLRHRPYLNSPWCAEINKDEQLSIMKEEAGWFWVETEAGRMGYVHESKVQLDSIKIGEIKIQVYQPWNPLEKPVVMTWEYAGLKTVDPHSLGQMQELQVVSPTWFHLTEDGLVINRADKKYVQWAHDNGIQVWGLFDNDFDPDLTHIFLNDAQLRIKAIRQLLSYVELYELDGINLDFENMYLKDKEAFVQFARELAPLLHQKERMLTVDVTFHSLSENWSMCYDRKGLAEVVDYLMVMGYDEHTSGSSTAGSVSSLPWVEKGLQKILEEVTADKLILGIPFYTRLWIETTGENGKKELKSKAYSLTTAEKWLAQHGAQIEYDPATGQNYAEVKEGNTVYRMWLEDDDSLTKRIELMKKYRLAGVAAWRRGFEPQEVWPLIGELVNKIW